MESLRSEGMRRSLAGARAAPPVHAGDGGRRERRSCSERLNALEQELAVVRRQLEVKQEEDDARQGADRRDRDRRQPGLPDALARPDDLSGCACAATCTPTAASFLENDDGCATTRFLVRRVRPIFEGTLFEIVDFRIMPDFGGSGPRRPPRCRTPDVNFRPWSVAPAAGRQVQGARSASSGCSRRPRSPSSSARFRRSSRRTATSALQLQGDLREGVAHVPARGHERRDRRRQRDDGLDDDFDGLGRARVRAALPGDVDRAAPGPRPRRRRQLRRRQRAPPPPRRSTAPPARRPSSATASGVDGGRRRAAPRPAGHWYWGPFGSDGRVDGVSTPNLRRHGRREDGVARRATPGRWRRAGSLTGETATFQGVVPRTSFTPSEGSGPAPGSWRRASTGWEHRRRRVRRGLRQSATVSPERGRVDRRRQLVPEPVPEVRRSNYNDTALRRRRRRPATDRPDRGRAVLTRFQVAF